jgi:hypothetical protein
LFVGEKGSAVNGRHITNETFDYSLRHRVSRLFWNHGADNVKGNVQSGRVTKVSYYQIRFRLVTNIDRRYVLSIWPNWANPRAIAGDSILSRKVVSLAHGAPLKEGDSDINQSGERDHSLKANFKFLSAIAESPPLLDSAGNVAQVHWYCRILAGLATLIVARIFLIGFVGTFANIEGCFTVMLIGAISFPFDVCVIRRNVDAFSSDTRRTVGNRNAEFHRLAVLSARPLQLNQTDVRRLLFVGLRAHSSPGTRLILYP